MELNKFFNYHILLRFERLLCFWRVRPLFERLVVHELVKLFSLVYAQSALWRDRTLTEIQISTRSNSSDLFRNVDSWNFPLIRLRSYKYHQQHIQAELRTLVYRNKTALATSRKPFVLDDKFNYIGHSVVLQTCTHHQEILYANNFQILKSVAQLQCVLVSTRDCILPRNGSKEPCSCQVDSYHRCWDPLYTSSSPSASASILRLPSLQRRLKIYGQRGEWAIGRIWPHWFYDFYSWHSCCMPCMLLLLLESVGICWNLLDPINLGSGCLIGLIGLIGLSNCRLRFDAKSTQTKGQHPSSKKGGHAWPNTASCTRPNNQRRRS